MAEFVPNFGNRQSSAVTVSHLTTESNEILDAMQRLRASKTFSNSERLLQFLEFVVAAKLRGEEAELKETSIGVGLYRRDPAYDTKLDSIVRTQARRVRERLEEYYKFEGVSDPVVLQLPKGGYIPVIELRSAELQEAPAASDKEVPSAPEPVSSPARRTHKSWLAAGGVFVLLAITIAYLYSVQSSAKPKVLNYTQLTHDGAPKWLVGTDGKRLFLGTGNYSSPGLAQIPVSGGEPTVIRLAAPGVSPLDVSSDGSQVLLADYIKQYLR